MEQLFHLSKETRPEWGSYIHLCRAVRGQGASKQEITNLFNKLISADEYDQQDKDELINYLLDQSKIGTEK